MDRMAGGLGLADLDHELSRAEVESVSSDNTVASGTNGNVQVVVRVRPPSSRERDQGYLKCVGVDPAAHSVTLNFRPQPRTFTFDYVSDEAVGQEEIFTSVGKPITDACLQGYHCCLIAYGQTGAGKTFTMEGPDTESSSGGSPGFLAKANIKRHEKRGLIPRILDYIFQKMASEKTQNCKDVEFVVKCSYLQIYNEQVSDLLDPGSYNLTIHEDAKAGMYVEGLQEVVVSTAEATYGVFRRGSENRHVGMTAMNLESSRSHSVFTVVVESQRRNEGGVMNRRTSRFYLVDLAGSERQKHSESAGIRLKEAGSINKSLSALGNVIKALVDISEGKIRHVPYRDSKLTFLLKDALGGNSKCTLIANVSPAEKNIDETLSTLKFAQRAKLIHNTAIVNEDMFGNPAVMGEEIRRLRLEIAALRANVGIGAGGDQSSVSGQESQSEIARTSRLEHIISQSMKKSLEAERKNEMEMHVLFLKLEATQAMCERLERTLQSQKMIIRLRENTIKRLESGRPNLQVDEIVRDLQEEIEQLRKQIEHHPDVVRFKMELDLCKGTLDEYEEERKEEELPFKMAQLENLNQTFKIEFQEMVEEKGKIYKELEEVKVSRDTCLNQLTTLEEQFALLREAVEKYRIEAAEAGHKQEKAEEKLQECTREQDEVWRRCNLAEAQATEYAQELTALKSQAEKMKGAFNQQTKLQEEIFLELQKATDELETSRGAVASLQVKLEEANAVKAQMDAQLNQAEEETLRTSRSLEEMLTACEKLAASVKEKDAVHVELSGRLEQADLDAKVLDEKVAAMSHMKAEAEEARDTAMNKEEELMNTITKLAAERDGALEEERSLSSEKLEKLRSEMDKEVQQISSILQSKLAQVEELEKIINNQANSINEKENLRNVAELETKELRHQLQLLNTEVSVRNLEIINLSSRFESSNSKLISILEEKAVLESKLIESEQTFSSLKSAQHEREEVEQRLSDTSTMLTEAKVNLEALTVENETLKSVIQDAENKLLEMSSSFEMTQKEYEALVAENQTVRNELERKTREFEAVTHQKSTLDACLSEELLRTAAAEKHIKDLMETILNLRADVAAMEGLKADLLEKIKEVEILEKHAAEHIKKLLLAENASQIAQEDCNRVSTTVKCLEDEKILLSGKIADLEVASTAMQGIIQTLEEDKIPLQTAIDDLQKENLIVKNEAAALKDLLQAKEEALRVIFLNLEDVRSELQEKAEELRKLEVQVVAQTLQIEAADKLYQALEAEHSRVMTTLRSLQGDKEVLIESIDRMEAASRAMEKSIESLKQEKVALQENLGFQYDNREKNYVSQHPTEEEVKDVDISNHVVHGETQVFIDPGSNHIDLLVTRKGDLCEVEANGRYSDDKEEDRRPHEKETDARLVAALTDVTVLKSHVAGCETKLDLAKSQVQADEPPLVVFPRTKDLAVQVALLTDECSELREALCLENCRSSTLEAELEICRAQEAEYAQIKFQVTELEKELESSLSLLEGVTMALEEKKSEGVFLPERIAELCSERNVLWKERDEVMVAKAVVETELASTTNKLAEMCSRVTDQDGELDLLRLRLENAAADALDNDRKLELHKEEIAEIDNKLVQAEDRLSEEQCRASRLEETRVSLESQVELLLAEKDDLRVNLERVERLLAAAKKSEHLKDDFEQRLETLKFEKLNLVEELQVLETTFRSTISSLQQENSEMTKDIEDLTEKLVASADEIARLQNRNLELSQTVDSHMSRISSFDALLRNTISDHEVELSALRYQLCDKQSELGELTVQILKYAADLQELRDEVQYNLGEVEYEFQKHVIDTEARMVDLESQKKLVQSEASESTAKLSAENSKFIAMLETMQEQVIDYGGKISGWIERVNSMESELVCLKNEVARMTELEGQLKQLETDLVAEKKTGSEYKQEILQLRARLSDQAKRTNPFSWNNSFGSLTRTDTKSLQGAGVKEDFVPRFAAQQKKRMAMPSKERPAGKSKTSFANQNSLSGSRALTDALPPGQTPRSQSQLRNAFSGVSAGLVLERPKKTTHFTRTAAPSRQALRPLSSNNTDELNRSNLDEQLSGLCNHVVSLVNKII